MKKKHIEKIVDMYINKTLKDCYAIDIILNETPELTDNKLGGYPYLPVGEEYPLDSDGNPMALLLQINLSGLNLPCSNSNKILEIFNAANFNIDEELKDNIIYFLNNYYNDVIEINIIGLAIILLRLFHRYVTIMNFGTFVGGTMGIHKKIGNILDQIEKEVNEKGLKEININDYLPDFDYTNELNDDMINYLQYCLERES